MPVLTFDVVPLKMGYEDDYIELTEELAEKCAALLLDYVGSTSNVYKLANESRDTLLEPNSSSCGSSATRTTSTPCSRL